MFTSIPRRFALTLPMLSALLVTLSGQPSPAEPSGAFVPAGSPGQANVMVGQAATVLSTLHYQAKLTLTCGGALCDGNFPAVAANRRLNLTRITCFVAGSANSTFEFGELAMMKANTFVEALTEYLPPAFSASTGTHTINQAVDLQVRATQHAYVGVRLATGTFSAGNCTV